MQSKGGSRNTPTIREAIMEATADMMVEEGYGAVSARRVADRAGIKPALLQYYYPTMDALFLALYQRHAGMAAAQNADAISSANPVKQLWSLSADPKHAALALEFMALANHRKSIRMAIQRHVHGVRKMQSDALAKIMRASEISSAIYSPAVVSLLIVALARGLVMEERLGITTGHQETRALAAYWLERLYHGADAAAEATKVRT